MTTSPATPAAVIRIHQAVCEIMLTGTAEDLKGIKELLLLVTEVQPRTKASLREREASLRDAEERKRSDTWLRSYDSWKCLGYQVMRNEKAAKWVNGIAMFSRDQVLDKRDY